MTVDHKEQALRLLSEVPLTDGHNDWPYIIRGWYLSALNEPNFDLHFMPTAHTDLIRLRHGHVGAQIWSAYVPSPSTNKSNNFDTDSHYPALLQTLQQIDLIHNVIKRHPADLGLALNQAQVLDVFRSGRIASLIGIEGLHQIANSASVLRMLHRLGVRYATLTHSQNNLFADSATAEKKFHAGLSVKGREIVREMNRIGMIVDLSHTSDDTQRQVLEISRAPVIYSHSSCYALAPHPRNTTDANLQLLKQNNGLIMISFLPNLTESDPQKVCNVPKVADHIIYAGELIGYEHVGIGSDFDGVMRTVPGLEDVSKFPALVEELLRRGVGEDQVKGVIGENFLRVFGDVEKAAAKVEREKAQILCDEVKESFDEELRQEMWRVRVKGE